jgi:hypothetical protein
MMKIKLLAAVIATAFALPALAQDAMPRVDQRQVNQEARIEQGVQTGQLTPKETAKLEVGQDKVMKKEAKAKSDGKVTPKERKKVAKAQDKQGKKIYKQKHDAQVAAPAK